MESRWLNMDEQELQRLLPMVRRTAQEWSKLLVSCGVSATATATGNDDDDDMNQLLRATWIGHSTFLVQMGRRVILTDPVFSDRASMVQWIGPRRLRPPALTVQEIASMGISVDMVLISHNHYDHLDHRAVMDIYSHWPDAQFFVPLKLKQWFTSCGIPDDNVVELDWWQHQVHQNSCGDNRDSDDIDDNDDFKVHFVPMQHWSTRRGYDRNWTLWGGFIVEQQRTGRKLFFSGDTGYCPVFKEVGERFGPIDLALIPIGAYLPRSIMKAQHVNPQEAVQIALDVKAKRSIGMHWGTFILTTEEVTEPRELLHEEVRKVGKPEDWFVTLPHGASLSVEEDDRVHIHQ